VHGQPRPHSRVHRAAPGLRGPDARRDAPHQPGDVPHPLPGPPRPRPGRLQLGALRPLRQPAHPGRPGGGLRRVPQRGSAHLLGAGPGRGGGRLHQRRVRGRHRDRRRQRRPGHAVGVPQHPVRRGPAHGQRLRHALGAAGGTRQPARPPTRLRHRLLAPPRVHGQLPRRRLRLLPQGAAAVVPGVLGAVDLGGLDRRLRRAPRPLRARGAPVDGADPHRHRLGRPYLRHAGRRPVAGALLAPRRDGAGRLRVPGGEVPRLGPILRPVLGAVPGEGRPDQRGAGPRPGGVDPAAVPGVPRAGRAAPARPGRHPPGARRRRPQARPVLRAVRDAVPGGAVALPVRHLAGALRRPGPRRVHRTGRPAPLRRPNAGRPAPPAHRRAAPLDHRRHPPPRRRDPRSAPRRRRRHPPGRGVTGLQTAEPADGFYSPRELTYIQPAGRRLSDYEAAICHVQPDVAHYDFGGWLILAPDGENLFEESSTRLRHPDWFQYRDPSSLWQRTYMRQQAVEERAVAALLDSARANGYLADLDGFWAREILARYHQGYGFLEWGLFLALNRAIRLALSDTLTMMITFTAVDRLRHQQAIAMFVLELEQELGG